ncbi:MAG: radical SAM protein [bacterium]|nr:radical SAM protein [bacterium]
MNGKQLYGPQRLLATMKMGKHKELKGLSLKQKLGMNYISKESKLTELNGKIYSNTFTPYFPSLAYDRFMKNAVATSLGTPGPMITNFAVTSHCHCNCWHCSFSNREKTDGMSLKDLKKGIAEVQDLGVSVIGITGGEPLLRNDLEEIIASIDNRSMPIMFTTGHKLTTERVRALKDAGLEIPVLSLDHYTAEVHDKGRRLEGVFEGTLKAIELFQSEGFYVAVSFVPDKQLVNNREDLFKTIDFFRDLGINDMRLTSPILSGELTCKPEEKLTKENVETIFEVQKMCRATKGYPNVFAYDYFESRQYYGCGAGFNYMFIDSQGNVSPCDFTMLNLGNIKKTPVKEIWEEMSSHFCGPSCDCYANVIHDKVASKKLKTWPMPKKIALEVLEECPPFDETDLPVYYTKMGFKKK